MDCGINFIKYLLFIFNFLFTLCGLALLIVGVIIHLQVTHLSDVLTDNVTFPSLALIVIGAIIFIIAFFGCCGAIRESHCMIVTFAMLLLTILVIQIAVAIFAFVKLKGLDQDTIRKPYVETFNKYWTDSNDRDLIDFVQTTFDCCGIESYRDYSNRPGFNGTIPWSCCERKENDKSPCTSDYYNESCLRLTVEFFEYAGLLLGGVAIGIAVIEFVGIIFALCLANSIRNIERRGYRV